MRRKTDTRRRPCHRAARILLAAVLWGQGGLAFAAGSTARVVVRIRDRIDVAVDRAVRERRSLDAVVPGSQLGGLNRRHGLRAVRTLRRRDAGFASMAQRRAAERLRARGAPSFAATYVFELAAGADAEAAAREYAADPAVEWAEPDRERTAQHLTDDPFLASSGTWGQPYQDLWGVHRTQTPAAWDVARGAGIVVAISDTGIDFTHPDLAANAWTNPGEIPANGVDDDGNGYVDDLHGWNFVADSADVTDDQGHGTHVAGTVAAVGDNGLGIVGIAYESRVMAVKGLDATGSGYDSDLAAGLLYAAENGARVVNASWGAFGPSQVLDDAIAAARAAGVVVVAAAGNAAADVNGNTAAFRPAGNRNVITVAAADHLDAKAAFSNFGTKIDVTAPGGGDGAPPASAPERSILSLRAALAASNITRNGELVVGGNWLRQAGTSMAAPHVAGAAAVILSAHPGYHPEEVRQAIRAGADDVAATGWDVQSGYGRLNVGGALAVEPLVAQIRTPDIRTLVSGDTVTVTGSAFGTGFAAYWLDAAPVSAPTTWLPLAGPATTPVEEGPLATIAAAALPEGEVYLRLRVTGTAGASFEDRVLIRLDRVALTAPQPRDMVGGIAEIRGSIAPAQLTSWRIEYRVPQANGVPCAVGFECTASPWRSDGITLTGGGAGPVEDGVLATFDTSVFDRSTHVTIRAVVETALGTHEEWLHGVVAAPDLRPGWPRRFPPPQSITYRRRAAPTLADVDADGTTEVPVAHDFLVYVLRHDGSDAPGWPRAVWNRRYATSFPSELTAPTAADLDGDGRLEIVVATEDLVFVFGHDGTLLPGWPHEREVGGSDCVLADLDGDGRPEIVVATKYVPQIGANQPARVDALRLDGSSLPGFPADLAVGDVGQLLAVGDLDGDAQPEIVATVADFAKGGVSEVDLFYGRGKPRPVRLFVLDAAGVLARKPQRYDTQRDEWHIPFTPAAPALADLDGDRVLDLAVNTHGTSRLATWRDGRRRNLRTAVPVVRTTRKLDELDPVVMGDLTGDGAPELVVASDLGHDPTRLEGSAWPGIDFLTVVPSVTGAPPTGWPQPLPFKPSVPKTRGPGTPSLGDLDGDGVQEIVLASYHCNRYPVSHNYEFRGACQGLLAFRADGSPMPGFPKGTPSPADPGSQAALGDLDGDGLLEIVWLGAEDEIAVWNVPGTPGPRRLDWPMARQNAGHTAALPPR